MLTEGGEKRLKRVIPLNGDKLGFIGGSILATAVMIICFYFRRADGVTTAIRVAWTFVVGYGMTFFLVRTILRITLLEFVQHTRAKRGSRLGKSEEVAEEATEPLGAPQAGVEEGESRAASAL